MRIIRTEWDYNTDYSESYQKTLKKRYSQLSCLALSIEGSVKIPP